MEFSCVHCKRTFDATDGLRCPHCGYAQPLRVPPEMKASTTPADPHKGMVGPPGESGTESEGLDASSSARPNARSARTPALLGIAAFVLAVGLLGHFPPCLVLPLAGFFGISAMPGSSRPISAWWLVVAMGGIAGFFLLLLSAFSHMGH